MAQKTDLIMKILIIDDEKSCRKLASRFFSLAGYTTETAENGKEGLNKAVTFRPDLILLDYMLPDITGGAALALLAILDTTKEIPVIMVTGHAFSERELAHLKREKNLKLVLQKPASFLNILEKAKEILSPYTVRYN